MNTLKPFSLGFSLMRPYLKVACLPSQWQKSPFVHLKEQNEFVKQSNQSLRRKRTVTEEPVLRLPDYTVPFLLKAIRLTDESSTGVNCGYYRSIGGEVAFQQLIESAPRLKVVMAWASDQTDFLFLFFRSFFYFY